MLVAEHPSEGERGTSHVIRLSYQRLFLKFHLTLTQVFLPVLFNTSANGHLYIQSFLVRYAAKLAFEFISLRVSAGTAYCS